MLCTSFTSLLANIILILLKISNTSFLNVTYSNAISSLNSKDLCALTLKITTLNCKSSREAAAGFCHVLFQYIFLPFLFFSVLFFSFLFCSVLYFSLIYFSKALVYTECSSCNVSPTVRVQCYASRAV